MAQSVGISKYRDDGYSQPLQSLWVNFKLQFVQVPLLLWLKQARVDGATLYHDVPI